jgi:SAM-dependent methyltransferase
MRKIIRKIAPRWMVRTWFDFKLTIRGMRNRSKYIGDAVFCPCCELTFSAFMDFEIDTNRYNINRYSETYKNTICPNCFSAPRHRIVCHFLSVNQEHLLSDTLIFGAEYSIRRYLKRYGFHITTADLKNKSAHRIIDIQNIPYPDDFWGLIICNHILEHVPDFELALYELRRVLKTNGTLVLSVPTDRKSETTISDPNVISAADRKKHYGQPDHYRLFGCDFRDILDSHGFDVSVVSGDDLPHMIVAVIGPSDIADNRIYICRVRG